MFQRIDNQRNIQTVIQQNRNISIYTCSLILICNIVVQLLTSINMFPKLISSPFECWPTWTAVVFQLVIMVGMTKLVKIRYGVVSVTHGFDYFLSRHHSGACMVTTCWKKWSSFDEQWLIECFQNLAKETIGTYGKLWTVFLSQDFNELLLVPIIINVTVQS